MDFFHVRVETNFMLENQVIYDKMNSYETIFFFFLPMMTDVTQEEKKALVHSLIHYQKPLYWMSINSSPNNPPSISPST